MKKHLFLILFAIVASVSTTSAAITVRLDPQSCSDWSTVHLWAWTSAGNVFNAWPGEIVSKDGDGWYAYTFDESITEVSIIWNNGSAQTVDITGITSSTCYALNYTGGTAITVRIGDCPVTDLKHIKIGDLYYNFDAAYGTAEVTYEETSSNNYIGLTSVNIPSSVTYYSQTYSVTSIGDWAFDNCTSLTSVTIGNSVTSIGDLAFELCTNLTSVTIPNSVTSIGYAAFYGCSSLTSVTIGNSVTSIGKDAFNHCSSLTNVVWNAKNCADFSENETPFYLKKATDNIDYYDIRSQITSLVFGDDVEYIPAYLCYSMENLTSVTFGNSVTSIGASAFRGCSSLTSVTIPNSVTSIKAIVFASCSSLTSITIGSGVTSIGSFVFDGCSSLTSITCMATTPPSVSANVLLSADCSTILLYVPAQSVGLYKEAYPWKNFRVLPIDFSGYTITFANWDGSILQLLDIEQGEIPEYTGVTPTRSDDDEFTYTFIGWSPTIVAATEDATYTATYEASPLQYYTIRFENWDNSELQSIQVAENKMPVYTGPTPTRPNDDEYTYTFIGWSPTIVAATEDATYTAKYEAKERAITVRLNPQSCSNWSTVRLWAWTDNGNIFDAWPGEIISKDGDAWYSYTFEKSITSVSVIWNNGTDQTVDINNVTESTCYSLNSQSGKSITVSAVSCPKKKYTITFVNWNGDELQKGQVLEGEMPQYAGLTPTRPEDENYTYVFSGWTPEIVAATEDATYTAVYNTNSKPNYYTIQFINWNGDELQKGQVLEGEMPQYAGLAPTRPDDENYTYEFSGWTPEIVPANEDATYTATYEESQKAQVGFESVVEENLAIRMIINNGQLFILRDGKTYTVQGQEVR